MLALTEARTSAINHYQLVGKGKLDQHFQSREIQQQPLVLWKLEPLSIKSIIKYSPTISHLSITRRNANLSHNI